MTAIPTLITTSLLGREFVNLTPHTINVFNSDGYSEEFPPSGIVARMGMTRKPIESAIGVDLFFTDSTVIEGIEHFHMKSGVQYVIITSLAVKSELREYLQDVVDNCYEDGPPPHFIVVSPGELIRNDKGQPIGCKGLDW